MKRVEGKIVIVTGAASGIGLATAKRLAAEGAQVVMTDRERDRGASAAAEIGAHASFLPQDVVSESEWDSVVGETVKRHGRLDVLVNNAGISGNIGDLEDFPLEEWRRVHTVNLESVFLGCRAAVRAMKGSGGGSIVNISSIAGIIGVPSSPAYSSSKAGVRLLTKSVALHCARRGYAIRCNSVHPSFIATPMVECFVQQGRDPARMQKVVENTAALGRLGQPDEVASMVLYLASDESRFVTGSELVIDGGATAQ
jgi:3(or 17)beta-hydroxysteroid dehydrogenase